MPRRLGRAIHALSVVAAACIVLVGLADLVARSGHFGLPSLAAALAECIILLASGRAARYVLSQE